MSRIQSLGIDNCNLPVILADYEKELKGFYDKINLDGANLEKANRENPSWLHYYDSRRVELSTIVDFLSMKVKEARGKLYKSYTENNMVTLNDRAKDKYIDAEPAYIIPYQVLLEAKEVYDQYVSVVESLRARGYALNNITRIRVSSLEDAEIN